MMRELAALKRKEGYEAATVRNILAPVRGMYNQAIEDGEPIPLNPAARFGKKNRGGQKTKINPVTKEETSFFSAKNFATRARKISALSHRFTNWNAARRTNRAQSF